VFFVSQAGISLLGEVNRVVTRLITRGDMVLRLRDTGLWIGSRIGVSHSTQNENYPSLTEDRATQFPSHGQELSHILHTEGDGYIGLCFIYC
jgi:hypothetical protein